MLSGTKNAGTIAAGAAHRGGPHGAPACRVVRAKAPTISWVVLSAAVRATTRGIRARRSWRCSEAWTSLKLYAHPTDLHLVVAAPQVLECPVGKPTSTVAGAVESSAGGRTEDIGRKLLRSQLRSMVVAARNGDAANEHLTRRADGYRLTVLVHHHDVYVRNGPSNPHLRALLSRADLFVGHIGRDLRRAIEVEKGPVA